MLKQDALRQWLLAMADKIGMTVVAGPLIHPFPHGGQGLTGAVIVAESHIFVHTWPEASYVSLDVDSCLDFNYAMAIDYIEACWGPVSSFEFFVLQRGVNRQTGEPLPLRLLAARAESSRFPR